MHPKSPRLLDGILVACAFIEDHTSEATLEDYLDNDLLRFATERNLSIIGEALSRIRRIDPQTAGEIAGIEQIIGLRNRLAHGYDQDIDNVIIWETIRQSLPRLQSDVSRLLPEFEE